MNGHTIFHSMNRQKNTMRVAVEPISSVEWIGTMAWIGSTVLVTASTISAPPAENIALATAAAKLPATTAINVESTIESNAPLVRALEYEVHGGRDSRGAEQHGHDHDLVLGRNQRRHPGQDLPGHHAGKRHDANSK